MRSHEYRIRVTWTGNQGEGTASYRGYSRDHDVYGEGKPVILGTADPAFRGDPARYNPEELLVATLSQCHMLWYLALCAQQGVVVTAYDDDAEGLMVEDEHGSGRFAEVVLRPHVTVARDDMLEKARELHGKAHEMCFIANSVNFDVSNEPTVVTSR